MKNSRFGKLNYMRFALRWREIGALKKEKATLVLSPHPDDIFISLYATILAGKLGKNIIGVNFFTSSDSSVKTKVNTTFTTIVDTSITRISEEIGFSRLLLSHGINYLPVFLGLKEAAIEKYYRFIASAAMARLPETAGLKRLGNKLYSKMASDYSNELGAWEMLAPLLKHFRSNIKNVVAPMGVGTSNIDHGVLTRTSMQASKSLRFGLYAEIPYTYLSDTLSLSKLRAKVPDTFTQVMTTKFNPEEKDRLLKKLYASQYEKRTSEAIFATAKSLGEVIFWKNSRD